MRRLSRDSSGLNKSGGSGRGRCVWPPGAVELEARGRRRDVWMRKGKGSHRTPRPLPQELAWDSAIPGDKQAQGEEEESGKHRGKIMGRIQTG